MHTIADATRMFGQLDGVKAEELPALDKALRNISNRFYLPSDGQSGRAFLYNDASLVALRLIYFAHEFGLDRWMCERYAHWLQDQSRPGEVRRCEEAIDRVTSKQEFQFHVIQHRRGQLVFSDGSPVDVKKSSRADRAIRLHLGPEIGRYSVPASVEIHTLLDTIKSTN